MSDKPAACEHTQFVSEVQVIRLSEHDRLIGFMAEITIGCMQCGAKFEFDGMSIGWGETPMTNVERTVLHAPISPPPTPDLKTFD